MKINVDSVIYKNRVLIYNILYVRGWAGRDSQLLRGSWWKHCCSEVNPKSNFALSTPQLSPEQVRGKSLLLAAVSGRNHELTSACPSFPSKTVSWLRVLTMSWLETRCLFVSEWYFKDIKFQNSCYTVKLVGQFFPVSHLDCIAAVVGKNPPSTPQKTVTA